MSRGLVLYRKGLQYFRDIWDPGINYFVGWEEAQTKIFLVEIYHGFLIKLLEFYAPFCERMLNQLGAQSTS